MFGSRWPDTSLELVDDRRRYEAAARSVEVFVAATCLAVHVEPVRHYQGELILGPGHRHVQQAALLLDVVDIAGGHVRGDAAINNVEHEHRFTFLALGRMD